MLSQMTGYIKCFNNNKAMSCRVWDKNLLKNTKIWERIGKLIKTEFVSESVYGDDYKYIKRKVKEDKVNTKFQDKKVSKENASCECLSLTIIDSVIRVTKKYYPQTLLEGCKYEVKKNKGYNLINDYLEFDNQFENESIDGFDNECESDESSD